MIKYILQGYLLGLAYVAPIGMQNLYVINSAITQKRFKAYQVALITTFFDISLALACFLGVGTLMQKSIWLKMGVLLFGSVAVIIIGIKLLSSSGDIDDKVDVNKTIIEIITTCFMVTWINPQALIDGSLLLGGFRVSLPQGSSEMFILGVCIASFTWFTGITTVITTFRHAFNSKIIRIINILCGAVIIYYGLRLGYSFIKLTGLL